MLIEEAAQRNRWRGVCPQAKALFAAAGLIAAYLAATPAAALAVAGVCAATTLAGARVPAGLYLRVLAAPLAFLALGALSLALAFDAQTLSVSFAPYGLASAVAVSARALAAVGALLFLALCTPLADLVAALRRLHVPETLLEMMVVGYRMLFVFAEARRDIAAAQAARLGYASPRHAWRALGVLLGALAVEVWRRAAELESAAQARCGDGRLRVLARAWPRAEQEVRVAALAATALLAGVAAHRWGL